MGIAFFSAPQLLVLLRPLIHFWLGHDYVLSQYIVLLIVINFILQISRQPALTFIDGYGLQWVQKWKSIIESALNIVFSLVALICFRSGLAGILLGTIGSTLLFVIWYEPFIVLTHALKMENRVRNIALIKILLEKLWLLLPTIAVWLIMHFFQGSGIFFLIKLMSINFVISLSLFLLIFSYTDEMKNLYNSFRKIVK